MSSDTLRTSWDANEAGLSPASVTSSDFGRLFSATLDGQIYAQPILAGNTVIAATQKNNVYGLDPVTGAIRWSRNVGPYWPTSTVGCGDIEPYVGITSTPVYDPATNSVFFLAKVNDGADARSPHFYMHSVDPATGAERTGWPLRIQGAPTNDPAHPFNPLTAAQRPGLLLLGGVVYAGFASHCDYGPYVGYVAGVKTTTPALSTMWSTEAGSSFAEAGIWQSGGGLVSDGAGRILLATGNGISPAPGPGNTPPSTLGESVVRLAVAADGSLSAQSFFSPANNFQLDQDDADLGSGGPMAIPAGYGTAAHPRLVVQAGKDGRVFLLDADDLGGSAQGPGGTDAAVATSGPFSGVWGSPGFYGGGSGYVYSVSSGGPLRALKLTTDGAGKPALAAAGQSESTFGFGSGSPAITSTGTNDGSALVWVVWCPGPNQQGELRAYDAVPSAGVLKLRYAAPIGSATKFSRVATDSGRVYVGTRDGNLLGFGRPTTSPLTGTTTDFGTVAVGTTASRTVTLTAARALTLSGVTTGAPFTVTSPALPRTLAQGEQLTVTVTFAPTTAGSASDTLSLVSDAGTTGFGLQGRGTQPGLGAAPSPADFGTVPTGSGKALTISITNTGTETETITGARGPSAPFSVTALPAVGSTVPAGGSVAVSVLFSPSTEGSVTDSLTVQSTRGSVTVPLQATAVTGSSQLTVSPNPLSFGQVPIGTTASLTFDVANTGNIGMTLKKAAPPVGVFNAPNPMSEGQFLSPGDVLHQTISFTPTSTAAVSATYQITADDGRGPQNLTITGSGVDDPIGAKYASLAGTSQDLGNALGAQKVLAGGKSQVFVRGTIYWSPATGAKVVRANAILTFYRNFGGPASKIGFPVTDQIAASGGGYYNDFSNGSIYWSSATGAHYVRGSIRTEWRSLKADAGLLGYPTTDELATKSKTGYYNDFKGGSIYWSSATGPHEVHGAIRTKWLSLGAESSKYGYPTSDQYAIAGGYRQDFKGGRLTFVNGVVK